MPFGSSMDAKSATLPLKTLYAFSTSGALVDAGESHQTGERKKLNALTSLRYFAVVLVFVSHA